MVVTAVGFLVAAALAAVIVTVDPLLAVGAAVALVGGMLFVLRPVQILGVALLLRVFLDILWWVPFSVGGLNLSQLFSGGVFVLLGTIVLLRARALKQHPAAGWALGMIVLLTLATIRAIDLQADVDILVRYYTAPLMLLATGVVFEDRTLRKQLFWFITLCAAVPVLYSMYKLATGMSGYVLHGYARLLGGYKNIHNHALVMMCFSMLFLGASVGVERRWQKLGLWALSGMSAVAIYFTYTRTGMLGLAVCIAIFLAALKRYRLLGAALLAGTFLVLLDPEIQDRFSDLLAVFDPTVESTERRSLGSGRWGLWSWSMQEYLSKTPADIAVGLGLGGHRITTLDWSRAFHRVGLTLDPHNDYLLFLYQMGPMGIVTYLGMLWVTFRAGALVVRHGEDRWSQGFAAAVMGLTAGVFVTNGVSNSFIHRSAPGWYYWCFAGLLIAEAIHVRSRMRAEAREERRPRLVDEGRRAAPLR